MSSRTHAAKRGAFPPSLHQGVLTEPPGGGAQYQGHEHYYESGGAIPEMYCRRDGYDSHEAILGGGHYDNSIRDEYDNDLWGNYRFQDSISYCGDGYPKYGYHPHGGQEGPLYVSSLLQGEGIYDPYARGYLESAEPNEPTPYHTGYAPTYNEGMTLERGNYKSYIPLKEETGAIWANRGQKGKSPR